MSFISGSYSRLPTTGGAALLRDDMVEKEAAATRRVAVGVEDTVRSAIGRIALVVRADRCLSVREAVLHKLRLKDDILKLASVVPRQPQCSSTKEEGVSYALL